MPLRHYKGNWGQCRPHYMKWSWNALGTLQKKIEVSKCDATKKQETLMEAKTRGN